MSAELKATIDWTPTINALKRSDAVRNFLRYRCYDDFDREKFASECMSEGNLFGHHRELLELALSGDELEIGRRVREAMLEYGQRCWEKREHIK